MTPIDIIPYAAIFLLFFAIVFFALKRTPFGENRTVISVISLSISVLIVWSLFGTNYLDDFSNFFRNFNLSYQMIILVLLIGIVGYLFYTSTKNRGRYEYPLILYGLAGACFILFLLPEVISIYHIPDFISEWQNVFLVIGIILGIFAISMTKKKN